MKTVLCLMGPTAAGKTPLAIELVQKYPCEIISVDSAMIYRDMNIGTAKPDAETLKLAPHRLIDILDPAEVYSAGRFRDDALREIHDIHARGNIPLLAGGTMLYFRVLLHGIADLPRADQALRDELTQRAEQEGWDSLHAELAQVDPKAAEKINPNDAQRIQRALEVYQLTGVPMTAQQETESPLSDYNVHSFALMPSSRENLHARIAKRFNQMLEEGFLDEVKALYARDDLSADLPSIRSVGYRQAWEHLAGETDFATMRDKAIAATRQLAKRQITWLRSWPDCKMFDSEHVNVREQVSQVVGQLLL